MADFYGPKRTPIWSWRISVRSWIILTRSVKIHEILIQDPEWWKISMDPKEPWSHPEPILKDPDVILRNPGGIRKNSRHPNTRCWKRSRCILMRSWRILTRSRCDPDATLKASKGSRKNLDQILTRSWNQPRRSLDNRNWKLISIHFHSKSINSPASNQLQTNKQTHTHTQTKMKPVSNNYLSRIKWLHQSFLPLLRRPL